MVGVVEMTQTGVSTKDERPTYAPDSGKRSRRVGPFWRHFWQMLGAMAAGMIATGAIFLTVVGLKTWDEVTTQYPNQALIAMAAGMTLPMAAWMLYRGMGRRNTLEMSAVMVLAVVPFLCLVWLDATKSAQCGGYCLLSILGMLALMRYRYTEYATHGDARRRGWRRQPTRRSATPGVGG
jgi:hypothetical protein